MTSFNGTISYEGEFPEQSVVDEAIRHAIRLRMLKESSGLSQISRGFDLHDGGQIYILDHAHVWRVHIVQPGGFQSEPIELPIPAQDKTFSFEPAGFVSGATTSGVMDFKEIEWQFPDDPDAPEGDQPAARLFGNALMPESHELFTIEEAEHKLGVEPHVSFSILGSVLPHTQFVAVSPGNYTGAMAPMVQLLLGLGRQVSPDYAARWRLRNEEPPFFYRPEQNYNYDEYGVAIDFGASSEGEVDFERREAPETIFSKGHTTQVSYDPRWNRTHGILWGEANQDNELDDVPMIVEVAQRGVFAMPFPVDEASKQKDIQDSYKKVYPALEKFKPFKGGDEGLFEAFGGFPTGENIPGDTDTLRRWVRAGRVMESPNDASDFYDGASPFSTYFGWAFHPTAPRAANTCWKQEDGRKLGQCWQIILDIREKTEAAKVRNSVTETVITALQLTEEIDLFKAERLPQSFAEDMVLNPEYDAFDDFEVDPDWILTSRMVLLKEGYIDYPANQCPGMAEVVPPPGTPYEFFHGGIVTGGASDPCDIIGSPHFKYYEPLIQEVLHFDFSNRSQEVTINRSDGPIFCTYLTKGLEILSYSYDRPDDAQSEEYNTRAECQYTGSWTVGSRSSQDRTVGYFYSTSKDFRKSLSLGSGFHEVRTGHRTGFRDWMSFCAFFARHARLSRQYYGYQTWDRESWSGKSYHASVMCAANNRSAFFVCTELGTSGVSRWKGRGANLYLGDSGSVRYGIIYNSVFHWRTFCRPEGFPDYKITCTLDVIYDVPGEHPCFGGDMPGDPGYSSCPAFPTMSDQPSVGTFDGEVTEGGMRLNGHYNDNLSARPGDEAAWSESTSASREFEWEVWGMGLDLMNAKKLHEGSEFFPEDSDPQTIPIRASDTSWWRCSFPGLCPTPPYWVAANYYGKKFVSVYQNIDLSGIKTFGAELSVAFGPQSIPFGVLE